MRQKPTIIVPYLGATSDPQALDIFLYVRPDTNGVVGESIITKAIERCPEYRKKIKLIYMVNIPGECIVRDRLIEHYYALKIYFARNGRQSLTLYMRQQLESFFQCRWEDIEIVGAFQAMELLNYNEEELFNLWVDEREVLDIHGQTIKKIEGIYVINYDVPALLKKNTSSTDIAVMLLRLWLPYQYMDSLAKTIAQNMVEQHILPAGQTPARAFHYSYGPFDQLRDGINFLFDNEQQHCSLSALSFGRYLLERGVSEESIYHLIDNPLVLLQEWQQEPNETSLFMYTRCRSYQESFKSLQQIVAQPLMQL